MAHGEAYIARSAYVNNLPPEATEAQMKQVFSQVGEAVTFRIVYDRQTGKPKGYGFCEFADPKLVDSAVRNLNGFEYKGYSLMVKRADQIKHDPLSTSATKSAEEQRKKKKSKSSKKTVDEITRVVSALTTAQKREILSQMKSLIQKNEKMAKDLLVENPQLAQALLLIQIQFELVQVEDIQALTEVANPKPSGNAPTNAPPNNVGPDGDIIMGGPSAIPPGGIPIQSMYPPRGPHPSSYPPMYPPPPHGGPPPDYMDYGQGGMYGGDMRGPPPRGGYGGGYPPPPMQGGPPPQHNRPVPPPQQPMPPKPATMDPRRGTAAPVSTNAPKPSSVIPTQPDKPPSSTVPLAPPSAPTDAPIVASNASANAPTDNSTVPASTPLSKPLSAVEQATEVAVLKTIKSLPILARKALLQLMMLDPAQLAKLNVPAQQMAMVTRLVALPESTKQKVIQVLKST